jgi:hypothetical protein
MKKTFTILSFCFFLVAGSYLPAQVLLAKWTFPTGTAGDSLADGGIPANLSMGIHTEGGTSAIDFSKNGATTKAAQATGWDNGANIKCWVIHLNTAGYETLKLSSKQQSGGNNPGPRDYMVQYRIGSSGTWTDVPGSTLVIANDWTTGALDNLSIPEACYNQASVYLRWIMTTNTSSTGGTVASSGIDKIDDIYIYGTESSSAINDGNNRVAFTISPNPSSGPVMIQSPVVISSVEFLDLSGRTVHSSSALKTSTLSFTPGFIAKGTYIVRITTCTGESGFSKLILY